MNAKDNKSWWSEGSYFFLYMLIGLLAGAITGYAADRLCGSELAEWVGRRVSYQPLFAIIGFTTGAWKACK